MHDVVVVGARCAGAATAMLLAGAGHDVLLVDKARLPSDTLSTHGIARGGVVQLPAGDCSIASWPVARPPVTHVHVRHRGRVEAADQAPRRVDILVAPGAMSSTVCWSTRRGSRRGAPDRGHRDRSAAIGRRPGRRLVGRDANGAALSCRPDGRRRRRPRVPHGGLLRRRDPEPHTSPCAIFYTYVAGLRSDGFEFYVAPDAFAGVFPTHGGEACVWLIRPTARLEPRTAGAARDGGLRRPARPQLPDLGRRVRVAASPRRCAACCDLPNYLRRPHGPGWALVGDAGYHRDPITGHGITDAFRDAELLRRARPWPRGPTAEPARWPDTSGPRDAMAAGGLRPDPRADPLPAPSGSWSCRSSSATHSNERPSVGRTSGTDERTAGAAWTNSRKGTPP